MAEPIVLVKANDPERKPQLYACPSCGQCTSPRIFACAEPAAHAEAIRLASDCYNCRKSNICKNCGAECEKHWLVCSVCRRKDKITKAKLIDVSEVEECFGLDSGDFYRCVDDAMEAGEEYVFASTFRSYHISAERVCEMALEDHHDDADISDLKGWDELEAAIIKFNKAQTLGSFDEDRTRIARVHE